MQDVNILHGVKTIMTNQTGLHVRLQKRDRLSIEYNIPMLCGEIRCVGALSPAQALRSWPSSKLPLLDTKENPRLCRGEKKACGEGRSRQEKVSELE